MIRSLLVSLLVVALLAGCGSGSSSSAPAQSASVDLSSLPVTIEGMLVVDVAEGDVDEDDYSEFNFGSLTVGEEEIPVQVSGSVLRSASLPEEGGRVRATITSKSDEYGYTYYQVSSITRL